MLEIIRRHFEALNDRSISVYFEHCNRFFYHKAALLAGSIPGWVSHRLGAGKAYRGLKGHLLRMMDRFLHCDNLSDIPREDLVKTLAKVMVTDEGPTLVPRDWEEDRVTTLSFVRLWNGNPSYEYLYDMEGKFWFTSAPEESRQYIEGAKKSHPERIINGEEVRTYLREYKKSIK
jgi:hypothetical protein